MNKDNEHLVDIILNNGNIDKLEFETSTQKKDFIERFGFKESYQKIRGYNTTAQFAKTDNELQNNVALAKSEMNTVEKQARNILQSRDIIVPRMFNQEEKMQAVIENLKNLGLSERNINELFRNGLSEAEISGKEVTFSLSDNPTVRDILDKQDINYSKENKELKVNAKLTLKEGFELDNNPKNKKFLDDNDITYSIKAEDERKVFVPLRGKKVGTLLAASLVMGPVPALALQIILNQTGLLDKLVDKHLLSLNQKKALEKGETIKTIQKIAGKDVEQYLFKDLQTGNINRVNVKDVQFPKSAHGQNFSPGELSKIKDGKIVEKNIDGVHMAYRVDLNEPSGIKSMYKQFKSDREYLNVPKPQSPDIDKLNYVALKGASGVSDIYGNAGSYVERDSFLEKFNLKQDYDKVLESQKTLKNAEMNGNPTVSMVNQITEQCKKFIDKVSDMILDEEQEQKIKR